MKIVNIVEKILNFNNQQKGKERSHMLASRPSNLACVAKVSERKVSDHLNLKILSPKQILQRLPISLAQVKEVIHLKTLQIIYSLQRAKDITEKVYNNILNSIML